MSRGDRGFVDDKNGVGGIGRRSERASEQRWEGKVEGRLRGQGGVEGRPLDAAGSRLAGRAWSTEHGDARRQGAVLQRGAGRRPPLRRRASQDPSPPRWWPRWWRSTGSAVSWARFWQAGPPSESGPSPRRRRRWRRRGSAPAQAAPAPRRADSAPPPSSCLPSPSLPRSLPLPPLLSPCPGHNPLGEIRAAQTPARAPGAGRGALPRARTEGAPGVGA